MPRSHPLVAAALTLLALAVAWVGSAHALASTDPYRIDSIDAGSYVLAAVAATCLVVATCVCSVPWGLVGGVGVTAGLWWGAAVAHARMDEVSGGWMDGFNDIVFLVPIAAAGVALIALATCATVAAVSPRERTGRTPGGVVL